MSSFRKDEIGIVIGTTNSGVEEFETTENKHHAELGNPAEFLKWYLGTTNYAACVSTACTSGAKAFSTARKLLENGVCKAVIAGGVDTLASMPSYGFHALEVLSHERTNPFSKNRDGISLGEGGALFVVVKAAKQLGSEAAKRDLDAKMPRGKEVKSVSEIKDCRVGKTQCPHKNDGATRPVTLLGIGETSDAYHSATPDPDGVQAVKAIQDALDDANLKPEDVDYINLHGTGTISNDLMEANAIYRVFGDKVPASSTKPYTGHCLGAAASIEAFICYQILKCERNLPIHKFDGEYDETLPKINLVTENTPQKDVKVCMSTSFGFGGTNAVVVLAAKQLGSEAAKRDLDAKRHRGIEVKSVSEAAKRNCHLEKKPLPSDCRVGKTQCPHRNNENKPSPEFLSSPQLTKKFTPLTEREGSAITNENSFHEVDHTSMPTDKTNQQMVLGKYAQPTTTTDLDCRVGKTQCPHRNNKNKPSPEFLSSPQLTKKFNPLTEREGSAITSENSFHEVDHTSMPTDKTNQQMMLGKYAQPTTNSNLAAQPPSCLAASCLPHSAPMVLIDEVLNVDMENQIVKTSVKIHDNKIFFDKEINGISPLVGIEFMAQTIGCYAYFKAGKTIPKIGFLLGTRQYENSLEKFENGKTYVITAQEIYGDNELVSFECLIYNEGEDENPENYIAKATINAFQPKDAEKYIKELG